MTQNNETDPTSPKRYAGHTVHRSAQGQALSSKQVDLRPLKRFSVQNLPRESRVRQVMLLEPDLVSREEFLAKVGTWLALLSCEYCPKSIGGIVRD